MQILKYFNDTSTHRFRVVQKVMLYNDKREILVLRFSKTQRIPEYIQGKWDFPGGGLHWEETMKDGLKRELKEELGDIRYKIGKLIFTWDWIHEDNPSLRSVCLLYEGKYMRGDIILNEEHDSYKWVEKNKLPILEWDKIDAQAVTKLVEEVL